MKRRLVHASLVLLPSLFIIGLWLFRGGEQASPPHATTTTAIEMTTTTADTATPALTTLEERVVQFETAFFSRTPTMNVDDYRRSLEPYASKNFLDTVDFGSFGDGYRQLREQTISIVARIERESIRIEYDSAGDSAVVTLDVSLQRYRDGDYLGDETTITHTTQWQRNDDRWLVYPLLPA